MKWISFRSERNRWSGTSSPGMLRMPTSPRLRGEVKRTVRCFHLSPRAGRGRIALAIRVRGSLSKRGRDCFENACHITQHIVVPKSQDAIVVIDKPFVANDVARVIGVLPAIHLNDETAFTADQVDRVGTDRLLTNELEIVEPSRTELIPESCLCAGGVSSQAPGTSGFIFIGRPYVENPSHPDCFAIRPHPARGERLAFRVLS